MFNKFSQVFRRKQPSLNRSLSTNHTQPNPSTIFPSDMAKSLVDDFVYDGCDHNHWLIMLRKPVTAKTPQETVENYINVLAQVCGSTEDAKERMYACSTSDYHGFQATMTEEMAQKFGDIQEVTHIIPDSYQDPLTRTYGGDQYFNGEIRR